MARNILLLGICQGAQSICHVLGAAVGPKPGTPHEFGYYPIYPTEAGTEILPSQLYVAQSHYHGFEIPAGAEVVDLAQLLRHAPDHARIDPGPVLTGEPLAGELDQEALVDGLHCQTASPSLKRTNAATLPSPASFTTAPTFLSGSLTKG